VQSGFTTLTTTCGAALETASGNVIEIKPYYTEQTSQVTAVYLETVDTFNACWCSGTA